MQGIECEIRYKQGKENVVADLFVSDLLGSHRAADNRAPSSYLDNIGVAPMKTTNADVGSADKLGQATAPAVKCAKRGKEPSNGDR